MSPGNKSGSIALISSHHITPSIAISGFKYLDRRQANRLDHPNLPIPQLQEAFEEICSLYNDTAYANREKIDECLSSFKRILGVDTRLHTRECFRAWRDKIIEPVFKITLTESKLFVKEIVVKAERDNIPPEIWEVQKFIRELLHGCNLFLDQYQFFQNAIEEGFIKIKDLLKNISSLTRPDHSLRRNEESILEECQQLLHQYEFVIGTLSMYKDEVCELMKEIKESVSVLNN